MPDSLSPAERSERMSRIRGRNTKPELTLRIALHRRGFRFRLHKGTLVGKPDLVLPRYGAAIFVHGCFWHRHSGCSVATTPKSNVEFWTLKFEKNMARDQRTVRTLTDEGWRVFIVWECQLTNARKAEETVEELSRLLRQVNV